MYKIYREWTATNLFVVPPLGINRARLIDNNLQNAYLKDEIKGIDYENGVYLLFRPIHQERFADFIISERERKARIIDEYDYPDGWTMLVYQYDKKWEKDVQKLAFGKFSEVSRAYQDLIPKTVGTKKDGVLKQVLTVQHQIFKKAPQLADYWKDEYGLDLDFKEDEFWEFYPEREVFNQQTLSKLI